MMQSVSPTFMKIDNLGFLKHEQERTDPVMYLLKRIPEFRLHPFGDDRYRGPSVALFPDEAPQRVELKTDERITQPRDKPSHQKLVVEFRYEHNDGAVLRRQPTEHRQ